MKEKNVEIMFDGITSEDTSMEVWKDSDTVYFSLGYVSLALPLKEFCDVTGILNAMRLLLEGNEEAIEAAKIYLVGREKILKEKKKRMH